MKTFTLLLLSTLFSLNAYTQCYEVFQRPYYPDPFLGGTSIGNLEDDIHSSVVDIGFRFGFFGDTVSSA